MTQFTTIVALPVNQANNWIDLGAGPMTVTTAGAFPGAWLVIADAQPATSAVGEVLSGARHYEGFSHVWAMAYTGTATSVVVVRESTGAAALAVSSLPSLPAGTNAIGSVSVSNFPATQPVSGSLSVANFPATQPVSGSVGVSSLPALPAGANAIGSVSSTGSTGTDATASAPALPNVGANFAASGPYASYVLIKTIAASATRLNVDVENASGAQIAVMRDDGTAANGVAPVNATVFPLAGGSGAGQQGGSWSSTTFKGRLQLYAPSASAFVAVMLD